MCMVYSIISSRYIQKGYVQKIHFYQAKATRVNVTVNVRECAGEFVRYGEAGKR